MYANGLTELISCYTQSHFDIFDVIRMKTLAADVRLYALSILLLLSVEHLSTLIKSFAHNGIVFAKKKTRTVLSMTMSQNWIMNVYQHDAGAAMIYSSDEPKIISQHQTFSAISSFVCQRNYDSTPVCCV